MKPRKSLPKTALPRIYFIDDEIASGTYPNASDLAKKYETSLSSINRDIAYMRDMMGAPIVYDFFKKGFYYSEKTFRLPAAYATADDLLALGMAKNLMELYRDTPIHESALNLLENITAPLQGDLNNEWFINRIVIPKTASAPVNTEIWNSIIHSLRENRTITFQYQGAKGINLHTQEKIRRPKLEMRRARPYQLLFDSSAWYLFAYDEDREKMRMFALSRITDVSLKTDTFTIEEGFDYRSLEGASYFGVYQGRKVFRFTITISGDTRWISERQWAADQHIQETKTGIKLSFTSNQFEKVLDWVLSQGPFARPLAPKALVERWTASIKEMAKMLNAKG
ncbi:MAG: WYL domain-containing protein [Treponema sp.]|nr:WYL domain-containing protein [Treponema sp.]